jgi:hypothetical protein
MTSKEFRDGAVQAVAGSRLRCGLPGHAGLVNRLMTRRAQMLKGPLVAGAAGL